MLHKGYKLTNEDLPHTIIHELFAVQPILKPTYKISGVEVQNIEENGIDITEQDREKTTNSWNRWIGRTIVVTNCPIPKNNEASVFDETTVSSVVYFLKGAVFKEKHTLTRIEYSRQDVDVVKNTIKTNFKLDTVGNMVWTFSSHRELTNGGDLQFKRLFTVVMRAYKLIV